jgi:peroxiredoxin
MKRKIFILSGTLLVFMLAFVSEVFPSDSPEEPLQAIDILRRVSDTYRNLKSYELYGVIRMQIEGIPDTYLRPIIVARAGTTKKPGGGVTPVGQATIRTGPEAWEDRSGNEVIGPSLAAFPRMDFSLERLNEHVKAAKLLPEETIMVGVQDVVCYVVEISYEPSPSSKNVAVQPQVVWIDKDRFLIVRFHQTGESALIKKGRPQPARFQWTLTFNTIKLNETPQAGPLLNTLPRNDEKTEFLGSRGPIFTLEDLNGHKVQLTRFRGRIVVLYFWSPLNDPSKEGIPVLEKLRADQDREGVEVWGIVGSHWEEASAWLQKNGHTLPMLIDRRSEVTRKYEVQIIPTLVILDREGKIASYTRGRDCIKGVQAKVEKAGVP